jgi:Fic family protein
MAKVLNIYQKVYDLQTRYCELAMKNSSLLKIIDEAEIPEQVYNSNAIENSTLSLEETDKILLQINLDRYVTEREIFEAKNLARVVSYIREKAKNQELNVEMLLLLHKLLLSNIQDDIAGRFRYGDEWVRVANHIAEDPLKISEKIDDMFVVYKTTLRENIIKRIALFHLTFEHIHPFIDGNGRIGRVLNNYLLIREGFVPINIKFIDRNLYYEAFKEFNDNGKTKVMEEIVGKAITNSFHKRLAYLERKEIVFLADYAKSERLSYPNLLNKAKRQSIEAFLEKGKWKIGK